MNAAEKGWKDVPIGGLILEAGSSEKYETGDWRTYRPVWDREKCRHCMICWVYCPDSSILVREGKMIGIDYEHCKGCGICAHECPVKCIKMQLETETETEIEATGEDNAKVGGEAGGK
ncbi:MAG: 4Fe-4S binding protein [Bacillota bacterium]